MDIVETKQPRKTTRADSQRLTHRSQHLRVACAVHAHNTYQCDSQPPGGWSPAPSCYRSQFPRQSCMRSGRCSAARRMGNTSWSPTQHTLKNCVFQLWPEQFMSTASWIMTVSSRLGGGAATNNLGFVLKYKLQDRCLARAVT